MNAIWTLRRSFADRGTPSRLPPVGEGFTRAVPRLASRPLRSEHRTKGHLDARKHLFPLVVILAAAVVAGLVALHTDGRLEPARSGVDWLGRRGRPPAAGARPLRAVAARATRRGRGCPRPRRGSSIAAPPRLPPRPRASTRKTSTRRTSTMTDHVVRLYALAGSCSHSSSPGRESRRTRGARRPPRALTLAGHLREEAARGRCARRGARRPPARPGGGSLRPRGHAAAADDDANV